MSANYRPLRVLVLASGVSAFALTYMQPAVAQQAAQPAAQPQAAGEGGLEEIVVTARRKEEKAQTVPIMLTTETGEALSEQHFVDIKDLGERTAGLMQGTSSLNTSFVTLRGVLGVAPYFDEVALPFPPYNVVAANFDLANSQVLKGPQGTLFGQSADPGVILFVSNPTTNDFSGTVEAEAGDYGHKHLEAVLNVPIVDNKLVVRVGGFYQHLDGSEKDLTTGENLGNEDYQIYRATITARPTDDIQNDFVAQYYWSDSLDFYSLQWYVNPVSKIFAFGLNSPGPLASYTPLILTSSAEQAKLGRYAFVGGSFRPGGEYASTSTIYLIDTARWDINDNMTLKNILGYIGNTPGPTNSGTTPIPAAWDPLGPTPAAQLASHPLVAAGAVAQYTEETQIQGKILDDKLGFTVGDYFLWGGTRQNPAGPVYSGSENSGGPGGGAVSGAWSWGDRLNSGYYGQGTYDLSDFVEGLSFTAGIRYTWDKEYLTSTSWNGLAVLTAKNSLFQRSSGASHLLSLDYQWSPTVLFYLSDAKGFGKGGFTAGNPFYTLPQLATYGGEALTTYEGGVKADWELFGVKTRTNLALFYSPYSRVQVVEDINVFSPVPGVPPTLVPVTANAPLATIYGVDGDLAFAPTDDLTLTFGWDANFFHFNQFINDGTNWADAWQFDDPRITWNASVTYKTPFLEWVAPGQDLGAMSFTATINRQDHNSGVTYLDQITLSETPGYANINAFLNWKNVMGVAGLDGQVYVRNLGQNVWQATSGTGYLTTGVTAFVPARPRTWGFTVRKSF